MSHTPVDREGVFPCAGSELLRNRSSRNFERPRFCSPKVRRWEKSVVSSASARTRTYGGAKSTAVRMFSERGEGTRPHVLGDRSCLRTRRPVKTMRPCLRRSFSTPRAGSIKRAVPTARYTRRVDTSSRNELFWLSSRAGNGARPHPSPRRGWRLARAGGSHASRLGCGRRRAVRMRESRHRRLSRELLGQPALRVPPERGRRISRGSGAHVLRIPARHRRSRHRRSGHGARTHVYV